jgi:hypothetical protein
MNFSDLEKNQFLVCVGGVGMEENERQMVIKWLPACMLGRKVNLHL